MTADIRERVMSARYLTVLAFSAGLGALALPAASSAQAPAAPKTGYKAPLAADGHPDLQGVWTSATVTRLERNPRDGAALALTEAQAHKIEAKTQAQID